MPTDLLYLIPAFFLIAALYSAAGFGGGSSYLAILALTALPFTEVRMTALMCNIAVVSGSLWIFHKEGLLKLHRIWPLVILSVPMAYLGGRLRISENIFFMLLAITLLVAGILMLRPRKTNVRKLPQYFNGLIGGGIGFLSGVVGIGGGIFLSPVLNLTRWANAKIIAATTALFILVNSISGLIGQVVTNGWNNELLKTAILVITVIIGGQIGARMTAYRLQPKMVRQVAGVLIIIVGLRLLFKYLF